MSANTPLVKKVLKTCMQTLRTVTPCSNIGIRMQSGIDYPFYTTCGYSKEFLSSEQSLLTDSTFPACICAAAATGTNVCYNDFCSTYGSYQQNHIKEAPDTLPTLPAFRGTCLKYGFNTLGIIPIRRESRHAFGLIHIADTRPGLLDNATLKKVETISQNLALQLKEYIPGPPVTFKPSVLIVDNSLLNALLINETIKDHCSSCDYAINGHKAEAYLKTKLPDIIITELLTSDHTKLQLIDTIRETNKEKLPEFVIFTAAKINTKLRAKLAERNISYILKKPIIDMEIFKRIIRETTLKRNITSYGSSHDKLTA